MGHHRVVCGAFYRYSNGALMSVEKILEERGSRYGSFVGNAEVSQALIRVLAFELHKRNKHMDADQYEALQMICHKIARIVNGDPDYADNWVDIAGYATLVANRLDKQHGNASGL